MKRILTLVMATALLSIALGAPALATGMMGQGPDGRGSLAGVPMGIETPKGQIVFSTKQPVSNTPKSLLGKQTLAVETSKHVDLSGKSF